MLGTGVERIVTRQNSKSHDTSLTVKLRTDKDGITQSKSTAMFLCLSVPGMIFKHYIRSGFLLPNAEQHSSARFGLYPFKDKLGDS